MEPYIQATNGGKNFYYEFSLLEYDGIPIVFLATDDEKEIYLCECTDTRFGEQSWTIVRTDYDTVVRVISRQLSLYEAIRKNGSQIFLAVYNYDTEEFSQRTTSFDLLKPENLPEPGVMIWPTNENTFSIVRKLFMSHSSSVAAITMKVGFASFAATRPSFERIPLDYTQSAPNNDTSDDKEVLVNNGFNCNMNGVVAA